MAASGTPGEAAGQRPVWAELRDAIRGTGADYTRIPLRRAVFLLSTIVGGLAAFGVVAPFLPGLRQGSFAVILLAAPLALVGSWILRERSRPELVNAAPDEVPAPAPAA